MSFYEVGQIINTHGIHGEVKVKIITDFPDERFKKGKMLYLLLPDRELVLKIMAVRKVKQFYLLTFENYQDINLVEKFKGLKLAVKEEQQQKLADNNFYHHEIIGLKVFDEENNEIGEISEVMSLGANDVWSVKRVGKKDLLLPAIHDVIKKVDIANGSIIADVLDGLDD
ncbi:ribosome maturation factor RimM [Liquorilactobacillus mali]|uniref:Ribosome maturation factor RimM n=1 Tax=Liquorilactobacillus mali KCTC 3596 = DSM 20444 TaxID=1046596 RepID=J0UQH9_9LACO|nr:ribosome maturation factor RimM [Liquorilactobacillus mali]EJE98214.1 Ribosome maturation factor rimM [Liquorilactobacillus mali KCTC 3596 = DSM 20444]KRN09419.1 16S rRNA processing protein [Liquorilactobacillus mali KCTC 3596 = DSM 20444]MDC7951936.1 ribosome maturation factor RimM [Liquorilactobacillus mali]QFQ75017.1 ribosome maturation factor RimM [Liquorilactobacillus mali]